MIFSHCVFPIRLPRSVKVGNTEKYYTYFPHSYTLAGIGINVNVTHFLTLSSIKSMMKSGKILFSPSGFLIAFHTSYIFVFVILKLDQTTFAKQLFIFAIHSTISRTLGLIQLVSSVANATDWNFFIITILLILQQGLFVVKKKNMRNVYYGIWICKFTEKLLEKLCFSHFM